MVRGVLKNIVLYFGIILINGIVLLACSFIVMGIVNAVLNL